jgi:hypothetical protein
LNAGAAASAKDSDLADKGSSQAAVSRSAGKLLSVGFSGRALEAGFSAATGPEQPAGSAAGSATPAAAAGLQQSTDEAASFPAGRGADIARQIQQQQQQQQQAFNSQGNKHGASLTDRVAAAMPSTPEVGTQSSGPLAGLQTLAATAANTLGIAHVQAVKAATAGVKAIEQQAAPHASSSSSSSSSNQVAAAAADMDAGSSGDVQQQDLNYEQQQQDLNYEQQQQQQQGLFGMVRTAVLRDVGQMFAQPGSSSSGGGAGLVGWDAPDAYSMSYDSLDSSSRVGKPQAAASSQGVEPAAVLQQPAAHVGTAQETPPPAAAAAATPAENTSAEAPASLNAAAAAGLGVGVPPTPEAMLLLGELHELLHTRMQLKVLLVSQQQQLAQLQQKQQQSNAAASASSSTTEQTQSITDQLQQQPEAGIGIDAAADDQMAKLEVEYAVALKELQDLEVSVTTAQAELDSLTASTAVPELAGAGPDGTPAASNKGTAAAGGAATAGGGASRSSSGKPKGIGGGPGAAAAAAAAKGTTAAAAKGKGPQLAGGGSGSGAGAELGAGTGLGFSGRNSPLSRQDQQRLLQQLYGIGGGAGGSSGGITGGGGGRGGGRGRPTATGGSGGDDSSSNSSGKWHFRWPWQLPVGNLVPVLVQAWLGAVVVSGLLWYAYQFLYKMPMQEVKTMASTAVHVAEAGAAVAHNTVHAASAVAHGVASAAGVETSLPSPEEMLGLQGSAEAGKKGLRLGKGLGMGLIKKGGKKVTAAGKAAGKGLKEAALLLLPHSSSSRGGAGGVGEEEQSAAATAAARLGVGLLLLAAASRAVDGASSSTGHHRGSRRMRGRPGFSSSSRGRGAAGRSSSDGSSKGAANAVAAAAGAAGKLVKGVVGLPGAVLGWRRTKKSSKRWWEHSSMDAADAPGVSDRAPAGVLGYDEGSVWGSGAGGMLAGDAVLAAADAGGDGSSSSTGNAAQAGSPAGKRRGGVGGVQGSGLNGHSGGYDADDSVYLQQYKTLMMRQPSWR